MLCWTNYIAERQIQKNNFFCIFMYLLGQHSDIKRGPNVKNINAEKWEILMPKRGITSKLIQVINVKFDANNLN